MPRIRTIKPDFFKSLTVGDLSPTARLTFIGLWCYADDNGVAIDDARLIRAEIWPLDEAPEILQRIREDLDQISEAGLITRYFANGKQLLSMNSWFEHQKISHPKKPRFPRPEDLPEPPPEVRERDFSGGSRESSGEPPEVDGGSPPRAHARVPCSTSLLPAPEEGGVGGGDEPEDDGPGFADLWEVYPRKVSKSAAEAAWNKAIKRGADPETIIAAARAYRDDPRRRSSDLKYTAHAATWLNQERYLDDPEPPPGDNVTPLRSKGVVGGSRAPVADADFYNAHTDEELKARFLS